MRLLKQKARKLKGSRKVAKFNTSCSLQFSSGFHFFLFILQATNLGSKCGSHRMSYIEFANVGLTRLHYYAF